MLCTRFAKTRSCVGDDLFTFWKLKQKTSSQAIWKLYGLNLAWKLFPTDFTEHTVLKNADFPPAKKLGQFLLGISLGFFKTNKDICSFFCIAKTSNKCEIFENFHLKTSRYFTEKKTTKYPLMKAQFTKGWNQPMRLQAVKRREKHVPFPQNTS